MVTVWLSAGPSLVSNDQLHVPLPVSTTSPTDAVSVTSSAPGSENVPVLDAVWSSIISTVALSAAMLGARLFTTNSKVVVLESPSLSAAVIVTVWDSTGPSLVSNDQLHVPSSLATMFPADALSVTSSMPESANVPVLNAV